MKKPFWKTRIGKILLFVVPMILKNQKGIKGTKNAEIVDKAADLLK